MSEPSPNDLMLAHQYLYYVVSRPVLTDYQYDRFCEEHGLDGIGGSDLASDYPPAVVALAERITEVPWDYKPE